MPPASALTALPAPLDTERLSLLRRAADGLDPSALHWISGWFAGQAEARTGLAAAALAAPLPLAQASAASSAAPSSRLTVLYGSQTGNARRVAEQIAARAAEQGLAARLSSTGDYAVRELAGEQALLVVISTQGDGDPPDDARAFLEYLHGRRAPRLEKLRYAVLALGDSSYPKYCSIGRALDARLTELGARAFVERGEADVDVDSVARPWSERALDQARTLVDAAAPLAPVVPIRPTATAASRDKPYEAEVLVNQRITAREAQKDVRHVEVALGESGLSYQPGDALGVWPRNPASAVQAVLAALAADGDTAIEHRGERRTLREWLTAELEITRLARPLVQAHASRGGHRELQELLSPDRTGAFADLLQRYQLGDLLSGWHSDWQPQELVAALRPLAPRLYSIASSQAEVGNEAHTTVALVDYQAFGSRHLGAASAHLADTPEGGRARIFIQSNPHFRLPGDTSRDVIMIGAGTGVAPYRGFLQERAAGAASGRNWLVFGEQHFRTQFLYQVEWQEALKRGTLTRIDLAFSRDQAERVYVQQRLREQGRELFAWLEAGAHLYVCGDAKRLAPDVHAALRDVIARHGARDAEAAEEYLARLQREKRYQRDVY